MRDSFIKSLEQIMEDNEKVLLLLMDIGAFSFRHIVNKFPDRVKNFGITEAATMSIAVGLSLDGWIPICYTITPFVTSRCFDQIRAGVGYHNANVKIVGLAAGISYGDLGATHHGIEDIALLRAVPGMTVVSPADGNETNLALKEIVKRKGPTYMRLMLEVKTIDENVSESFSIGKASLVKHGTDLTVIVTGEILREVIIAANKLEKLGVSMQIINMSTIKPIDKEIIKTVMNTSNVIITVEEHSIIGGLGSSIAETLCELGIQNKLIFERIGINDVFVNKYGTKPELYKAFGLDSHSIYKRITAILRNNKLLK